MDGGLLSLKWNNHRSTFFYVLSNVRKKECYTDVTLACDGKFYKVHKLVLSTCSEYFEQMFEETQCKHPVIVLKDIRSEELESLLSYMYVGEVNVVQEKLSGLIKAAECLRIKGLAVPDEEPSPKISSSREKRTSDNSISSDPKRRRQDESGSSFSSRQSNVNRNERRNTSDNSNKFRSSNVNNNSSSNSSSTRDDSVERSPSAKESRISASTNNSAQMVSDVKTEEPTEHVESDPPEVTLDEPTDAVKQEPVDLDAVYLSDSNSASETKDILMDNFDGDGQQHFMDELLGQGTASDQGNMGVGEFVDGGEGGSSSAGGSQQHMVGYSRHQQHQQQHALYVTLPPAASTSNSSLPIVPFEDLNFTELKLNPAGYFCPVCPMTCKDKDLLRRHYRIHSGEKPFACTICSYKATQKCNLKMHLLKHKELF